MKKIIILLVLVVAAPANLFALNQPVCNSTCLKSFNCNNNPGGQHPTETDNPNGTGNVITSSSGSFTCDDAASTVNNNSTSHSNNTYICSFIKYGGKYQDHAVLNCFDGSVSGAPINAGLIFLIIAGGGAGFFFLRKQQNQTPALAV